MCLTACHYGSGSIVSSEYVDVTFALILTRKEEKCSIIFHLWQFYQLHILPPTAICPGLQLACPPHLGSGILPPQGIGRTKVWRGFRGAPWIESGAEMAPTFLRHSRSLQQPFCVSFLQFPGRSDGQLGAHSKRDSVWAPSPRQGSVSTGPAAGRGNALFVACFPQCS